jgi:L-threonylcarbamoyladenylate synthase
MVVLIAAANADSIRLAARVLDLGGVVAIPTETVYGLAASLQRLPALHRVYEVKSRPLNHPLIVHVAAVEQARQLVHNFPASAEKLALSFWPGPLTLVLTKSSEVPDCITAGQPTVAIRIPKHPVTLQLLRELAAPLAAPSANRFTQVSPTRAAHVAVDLGHEIDFILDGGTCAVGLESTVLDLSGPHPVLLRPGAISREALEFVLETAVAEPSRHTPARPSPGQHPLHYSPRAEVRIESPATIWETALALEQQGLRVRVFSENQPPDSRALPDSHNHWLWPAELEVVARELYARLRQADHDEIDVLLVTLPQPIGLGLALADRLRRAAGKG